MNIYNPILAFEKLEETHTAIIINFPNGMVFIRDPGTGLRKSIV